MNIKISGCLDVRDGYGYITQELSLALARYGHEIWLSPFKGWYSEDQQKPELKKLMRPIKPVDFELTVYYPGPISSPHNSGILSMYEANRLPTPWVESLSKYTNVFGPSHFVTEVFKDSGVTSNVQILPLGVDKEFYSYREREVGDVFTFLSLGKMEPRKNSVVLVQAFLNAFGTREDVKLVIKSRERFVPKVLRDYKFNNISIIEKTLTVEELLELYYSAHCFVYPTRGEGFSFPPRNALATGMPTIVTGWSATNEIHGAYKIPVKGFSPMHPCNFSYGEEANLLMADVNVDDLATLMLNTYENYSIAKEYREQYYSEIDWDDSARLATEIIRGLV